MNFFYLNNYLNKLYWNLKIPLDNIHIYHQEYYDFIRENIEYFNNENIPSNSLVLKLDSGNNIHLYQHKENGEDIKVTSYPIYADFVYETEELLLTITGTTQTLRESNIQLDVQDNSLINSLIDKLLYSVRLN